MLGKRGGEEQLIYKNGRERKKEKEPRGSN
jgi:hypothetical protein